MERKLLSLAGDPKTISFLKLCFLLSLVLHIIAAVFSLGFFHYDEHYQILEFAGLKAGYTTPHALPWEYASQIRPALQPWIAFLFIKLQEVFGAHNPFLVATILRMLSGLLGWASSLLFTLVFLPILKPDWVRKFFILCNALLWFLVFIHVRFSSESWSGAFFFIGICLLLLQIRNKEEFGRPMRLFPLLSAGFCLGLSCVFRLQSGALLPGLLLWALVFRKTNVKQVFIITLGLCIAAGMGFLLDRLYYGQWVNTAYRYFDANLIQGKAAQFGVEPWYYYITAFMDMAVKPYSIFILFFVLVGLVRYPRHVIYWCCIPFILLHMLIGHKELRFLFPIANAVPLFMAMAINGIVLVREGKAYKAALIVLAGAIFLHNALQLYRICFTTPHSGLKPLSYVYTQYRGQDVTLLIQDKYFYGLLTNLPMNFYRSPQMHLGRAWNKKFLDSSLQHSQGKVLYMISSQGFATPREVQRSGLNCRMEYSEMPLMVKSLNFNGWVDRTSFWKVYGCEEAEKPRL